MVGILRRGERPEDRVHEVTCRNCNSLLSFKQSEARIQGDQREGDYFLINCPVCERDVAKAIHPYTSGRD